MKRWLSYGAACVAAVAVIYGTLSSANHPSTNNTAWVAALTKQAGANSTAGTHADAVSSSPAGTVANTDASLDSQRVAVMKANSAASGKASAQGATSSADSATSHADKVVSSSANLTTTTTTPAPGSHTSKSTAQAEGGAAHQPTSSGSTTQASHGLTGQTGSTKSTGSGTARTTAKGSSSRNSAKSAGGSQSSGTLHTSPTDGGGSTKAVGGTSSTPPQSTGEFTILVTEDNGKTEVAEKHVSIQPGVSLMQYMGQLFHIETAYGGAFIVSIEGIRSQWTGVPAAQRQPVDWFLYVNGKEAPVGAGSIYPKPGDIDIWDYHRWDPSTGKG
jgi:hypothetical protein